MSDLQLATYVAVISGIEGSGEGTVSVVMLVIVGVCASTVIVGVVGVDVGSIISISRVSLSGGPQSDDT